MQITSAGQQLLDRSGTLTLHHYNGPALYVTGGNAAVLATYADSKTGYKGYADIVSDYYGNGRTVLIGSHPELSPQYPDILANLIAWAANVSGNSDNDSGNDSGNSTNPVTATVGQISTAASSVKTFYENNHNLPNYVTINSNQVSMPQFLYLLASGTIQGKRWIYSINYSEKC